MPVLKYEFDSQALRLSKLWFRRMRVGDTHFAKTCHIIGGWILGNKSVLGDR